MKQLNLHIEELESRIAPGTLAVPLFQFSPNEMTVTGDGVTVDIASKGIDITGDNIPNNLVGPMLAP